MREAAFSECGAHWNVAAEIEFFCIRCQLVGAGCGVAVVDPVVSRPFLCGPCNYRIAILSPTHEELSLTIAGRERLGWLSAGRTRASCEARKERVSTDQVACAATSK